MYKLLAMDLDGTLLDNNSALPDQNAEYIQKAINKGVHVVICSGRSIKPLEYYCNLAGMRGPGCYAIGFNGGLIFENNNRHVIRDIRLDRGLTRRAVELINEYSVEIVAYTFDKLLATRHSDIVERYSKVSMTAVGICDDLSSIDEGLSKILATGDNTELLKLEKHAKKIFSPEECNIFLTSPTLFELTAIGADKGSGLAFLAKYLGVGMDEVIAVGDYYNDIQMLQISGLGVAVSNAVPEVKAVAGYITEADNAGGAVKEVIEKFILV